MLPAFVNALRYLDMGKYEKGEESLKAALERARTEKLEYEIVPILCCYGQLLFETGRFAQSQEYLSVVVKYFEDSREHRCEYEIANELLDRMQNRTPHTEGAPVAPGAEGRHDWGKSSDESI